jgi:hypothetical protein
MRIRATSFNEFILLQRAAIINISCPLWSFLIQHTATQGEVIENARMHTLSFQGPNKLLIVDLRSGVPAMGG